MGVVVLVVAGRVTAEPRSLVSIPTILDRAAQTRWSQAGSQTAEFFKIKQPMQTQDLQHNKARKHSNKMTEICLM